MQFIWVNDKSNNCLHQTARKPRQKMPTIYKHKYYDNPHFFDPGYNRFHQNPELGLQRAEPFRKARLDANVEQERQQMIMKTGRNSLDDPEWMKGTISYYKKSSFQPPGKIDLIDERSLNIISNKRKSDHVMNSRRNQDNYYKTMIREQMSQSVDLRSSTNLDSQVDRKMRSTLNWRQQNQPQVSPKIGALDTRDYTIRKPLLKVGKLQFVNTYSPFEKF